jgi:starch synthase
MGIIQNKSSQNPNRKRILVITQEMDPYLALTEAAKIANELPKHMLETGMEIRVLMPKYGVINERRHRLHEVVRLSGINVIIDDEDFPLVIKVASLPGARLQVYFLDNEDFFKRKTVFHDENNKFFEDNSDRMIFFCKGALETVRKFGWAPDIIHCFGWMTSLIPMYLKTTYKDDPVFANAKTVYNVFKNDFKETLKSDFTTKLAISDDITKKHLEFFKAGDNTSLTLAGLEFADALVVGETLDAKVSAQVKKVKGKKIMKIDEKEENPITIFGDFYKNVLSNN